MSGSAAWLEWLSTWSVIKASGFTSYALTAIACAFGAFSYGKTVPARVRGLMLPAHQFAGWLGLMFGAFHGAVLTIDKYEPFSLAEWLVPFTAEYRPIASGLGTVAFYLAAAVLISSDLMNKLGKKVWRKVHLLSYPMFIASLVHGLIIGSDSEQAWAVGTYAGGAALFAAAVLLRGYTVRKASMKPQHRQLQSGSQ